MSGRLEGKVALITGAARGQGAAAVRQFVAEGAKVLITDVLDTDGEVLAKELGDAVAYCHLDVTSESDWATAVADAESRFGKLDVLVNNAGILKFASVEELTVADLHLILEVNLVGTFIGMRTAIPAMKRAGGGSIVNISSTEGLGATVGCAAYTASKFGVRGITKVAAIENGKDGIRTNSVHPGSIDTNMMRDLGVDDAGMEWLGQKIPGLQRVGLPGEVASVVLFLASDESSYCNGAEFVVDGGITASAGYPV